MDPANYENDVLPSLAGAIPGDLEQSFKSSLKARLKYGYDYSLRKRFGLLVREHEAALERIVPDAKSVTGQIADLRNWLTHLPPDGEVFAGSEDYLRYNFVMRVLLELSFLAELGFSSEEIADLAANCEGYKAWKERLF